MSAAFVRVLLVLLLSGVGVAAGGLRAGGHVVVRPWPLLKHVTPGEVFDIDIYIETKGRALVQACDIRLAFDPSYLQVNDLVSLGGLPAEAGSRYDNTAGTLDYGAYVPGLPAFGSFGLCRATFTAIGSGPPPTVLTTQAGVHGGILVVGPSGIALKATWIDGRVLVKAPPPKGPPSHGPAAGTRPR